MRRYLWLRFVRTYPLHLFVLLLFVGLATYREGFSALIELSGDGTFWRQLFLLHGLGLESKFAWNVPSWSLSSEWACYLIFPAVAPLLMRVKGGLATLAMAAGTLALTILCMNLVGYQRFDAFLDWGLLRIAGEFFTGCWLYRLHKSGLLARVPLGPIAAVAIAVAILMLRVASWKTLAAYYVCIFAVLILGLAQNRGMLRLLGGNPVSVYLGEISYSLYMLHWFITANAKPFGLNTLPKEIQVFVLLGAVLIGASLSYHVVEQISRRRLRDFWRTHGVAEEARG